jgi:hypothetical protein
VGLRLFDYVGSEEVVKKVEEALAATATHAP